MLEDLLLKHSHHICTKLSNKLKPLRLSAKASLADSDDISTVVMLSYQGGYSCTTSAWWLFLCWRYDIPTFTDTMWQNCCSTDFHFMNSWKIRNTWNEGFISLYISKLKMWPKHWKTGVFETGVKFHVFCSHLEPSFTFTVNVAVARCNITISQWYINIFYVLQCAVYPLKGWIEMEIQLFAE